MITRKRVKTFNKILTCLLCKGYLIEATTINTCMHSFCRSCIVKHVKVFEKYFCPNCETDIRLSNLRPDMRLRSLVYKIIPGLFAKEQQESIKRNEKQRNLVNGSTFTSKLDKQLLCSEDDSLSKQYFYDQNEPISLSLEYHMESIFGNTIGINNIPQVRYLQAPAAFKVVHLKKFLSSKYDLNNLKKSMNIDIIYESDVQPDEFSLMDIAYAYNWEREAPLKLFYRIYKSSKKHTSSKLKMIEKALNQQPFVKLSSDLKEAIESTKASKCEYVSTNSHESSQTSKNFETPRHDLKIIIAKKSSSKSKNIGVGNNKLRLNKPNGNSSKVLSDFERLRGDVDSERFSSASSLEIVSTSEMKPTLSKKSGTVSHHDLKFENKSNVKKHNNSNSNNNNSSASHDYYYDSGALNEREKEKCYSSEKQQKRESTKHAKNNEKVEKIKASKSNLSLNVPKLKIELPSLKTTITVPKTPNDTYSISSKSPHSPRSSETPLKKVRFDISSKSSSDPCFNFNNDESNTNFVNQKEYAAKIGLKPVERKVESIILHRKRKKSKHSREAEHSKRPKLHVSSSLDESLKLKLKIMGGKSCKKTNEEDASTCNLKTILCKTTADLPSTNEHEEKQKNIREKQATGVTGEDNSVGMENHKYSVTEQKNIKSGSDQPMVFIPKLVLQKTPSTTATDDKLVASSNDSTQRRKSFLHEQSKTNTNESIKSNVKSFDAISSSDCVNPKLMKPPTAKMGSPKQSQISTTFSLSPIRPHSIPASLKLSPISQSPPSTSVKSDLNIHNQNLKRSLSLGAEKSTSSYMNSYMKSNKISFQNSSHDMQQFSKVPPLIPSANSMLKSFYGSMIQPTKTTSTTNSSSTSSPSKSQSPHHSFNKLPNINVKDPIKLFPNACPSVEILKIPQKTFSPAGNIKLNRPMHSTIPLERIRKSAQSSVSQKILPKPQINQSFQQSPQCSSQTLNYSGIYQMPVNHDISLERYTLELTHDIAKLDQSLSLEKNFEHWEKRKLEEYSKLNELKNFPMPTKNLLNLQQNLSVRNIPNPSALMMSRNQTSGFKNDSTNNSQKNLSTQKETVTSSNLENSDIEEILSKSTIAKANEKQNSDLSLHKSSHVSKVNDKKSIEKLTEYLRLTAAKSRDNKQDDDNNNNNNKSSCDDSSANGRNYSVMNSKSDKFMNVSVPSVDVICIDS